MERKAFHSDSGSTQARSPASPRKPAASGLAAARAARDQRPKRLPPFQISVIAETAHPHPSTPAQPPYSRQEIAQLAYLNWRADGCPLGRDQQYWLEAESQLKATWHLLVTSALDSARRLRRKGLVSGVAK